MTAPPSNFAPDRFAPHLERCRARGEAPGIQYAASHTSGAKIECCAGAIDAATEAPVTPQSVFASASCSKALTAILILQCVDAGVMRLSDPLRNAVPKAPYPESVTLHHLLCHTAGLANPAPLHWLHRAGDHAAYDERAALDAVVARYPKLLFEPGARQRYSNLGYWLLGRALERVRGRPFGALLAEDVTARLGLAQGDLSCDFPQGANVARGHFPRGGLTSMMLGAVGPRWIWEKPAKRWLRCTDLMMNGPAYGGVFATASAYVTVLKDLLAERPVLLSHESRAALLAPQHTAAGRDLHATLGFRTGVLAGQRYLSKPGGGPGFSGDIRLYPERGLATAWFRNNFAFSESAIWAVSNRLDAALL